MKISWNWLSDYVDLDGLEVDAVVERLTMSGLEVDGVERLGEDLAAIVVGEIRAIEPHPQADKLTVCQVFLGDEPVQIVCGASNMRIGDHVPVIPAGERLPDGTKIKRGKIRGEISNGMMCSATELGLGTDASGLLILDKTAPVGASVADVLGLRDVVIDISITPNRGDCLSYLGIAREVAALFERERRYPGALAGADPLGRAEAPGAETFVQVRIADVDGCPRYAGAVVLEVVVGPSPEWLARRLEAIGQRPVNNLVDVTNYVMFETGQPLHAFDLDALPKDSEGRATIEVRRARENETLVSLDHVARELGPDDVVITDGATAIAVAGVMGGVETEVSEATHNLLLECAHFTPRRIRRSARRLGMNTESSFRFERVVDPEGVPRALGRAVELVLQCQPPGAGAARAARGLVDAYPARWQAHDLVLRPERCRSLLGLEMSAEAMVATLGSIDIPAVVRPDGQVLTKPPSFRPDLEREVDLIEEVGRLYGIDRLEPTLPVGALGYEHRGRSAGDARPQTVVPDRTLRKLERLSDQLAHGGLREAVNYSFVAASTLEAMRFDDEDPRRHPVVVQNPLTEEWAVMRTTLLGGLLTNARHNWGHQERSIALYEIGPVFLVDEQGETGTREERHVAALLMGEQPTQPLSQARPFDGLDLKASVLALCAEAGVQPRFENHEGRVAQLHPGVGALVHVGRRVLGFFGQVHPEIAESFAVPSPVYVLELSLDTLLADEGPRPQYQEIARYPAAHRDVAMVVPLEAPYGAIEAAVASFSSPLVESVALASVYRGAPIPEGKQSVALAISYRSGSGSLTDAKVDAVHQRLAEHVLGAVGGELR